MILFKIFFCNVTLYNAEYIVTFCYVTAHTVFDGLTCST